MTTSDVRDLDRLERETFRRFYDDGIFDLYLAAMLSVMPLYSVFESNDGELSLLRIVAIMAVYLVITVVLLSWRRHLLRTRLGEFTPGPARSRKIRTTRLVLAGSVLLGVIAFVVTVVAVATSGEPGGNALPDLLMPVVWFVNATVVFGAMAYFLDVPRLLVIGALFGSVLLNLEVPRLVWDTKPPLWVGFGIPAAIIAVIGAWKLVGFLRTYPPLPRVEGDA